ncbi:MAG: hypothetical protein ACOYD4_04025 [Solirubrobacterales bacterium]
MKTLFTFLVLAFTFAAQAATKPNVFTTNTYGANIVMPGGSLSGMSSLTSTGMAYFNSSALVFSNSTFTASGSVPIISTNRTWYVRKDGSDANTGTADTAGGAWLTIQKAVDMVSSAVINPGIVATIQVRDGTYNESVVLRTLMSGGSVLLIGNQATPSNVNVTNTGNVFTCGSAVNTASGWAVSSLRVASPTGYGFVAGALSSLTTSNVSFGSCNVAWGTGGGRLNVNGNNVLAGSGTYAIQSFRNGSIIFSTTTTNTISGTPAWTAFAYSDSGSYLLFPLTSANVGSATGNRYSAIGNGVIDVQTGGANVFPGNAVGTTATGGQYY